MSKLSLGCDSSQASCKGEVKKAIRKLAVAEARKGEQGKSITQIY